MNTRSRLLVAVALVAPVLSVAVPAFAQAREPARSDPTQTPLPTGTAAKRTGEPPRDSISTAWSLGGNYTFAGDLEDDRGDLAIARAAQNVSLYIPAEIFGRKDDRAAFTFEASSEWSWYDFGTGDNPITRNPGVGPIRKPFSQVASARLTPGYLQKLDDRWSVFGGLSFESAGESDADFGDTLTYGGFFAARYKVSDTFSLTFGASVSTQIEDDVLVIPLVGFEWQATDRLNIAVTGPGLRASYDLTDELVLSGQISYEGRGFRLASDSSIPDGVVRDQRVIAGLQLQWTPRPWLSLRGEAGIVPWSEIAFETSDGDEIDNLTIDPTGYVGASVTFRF